MKRRNNLRKKILYNLIQHIEKFNRNSPFPLWDSYITDYLKNKYEMDDINYDEESVDCCEYCKNIHILKDEDGNDRCSRCNNVINDEFETFPNIFEYLKEYGHIWGMKYNKDGKKTS